MKLVDVNRSAGLRQRSVPGVCRMSLKSVLLLCKSDHFSSWSGLVTGFMKLFSNIPEILGGVAPPYFVGRYVHSLQYE